MKPIYEKNTRLGYKLKLERLQDMDKILRSENINLKLRINKAIEYIEKHSNSFSVRYNIKC